jgi:hypothetical protein
MLVIRREQLEVFARHARRAFEDEMVLHSKSFSPQLCEVLGEPQLRVALDQAIEKAESFGLTNRGPVRLFIELRFLFGSGFDSDPQYPWASKILTSEADQMARAEALYDSTLDYQRQVSGPAGKNTRIALAQLGVLARQASDVSLADFLIAARGEMTRIFPEKAVYVGESGLDALVRRGQLVARNHDFSTDRAKMLIVALMFAFGHRCTDDPLYPWIETTLTDPKIVSPAARADRLERKALTWLDQVLANFANESADER